MSDQPWPPIVTGTDRQYETFLGAAEADRDRYQLLLDINNAVVTRLEVLTLIAQGYNTKRIAFSLNISPKTVESHRAQLMERLRIHDIAGLVRFAIRMGLVKAEER